jgi:hypothetical protein
VAASYWITYGVAFIDPSRGDIQWRIPVGFQLVPVGLMMFVIPFMKESPRWLATKHKNELALKNLAWIRKTPIDDPDTQAEFAEIIAAVEEEEAVVGGRSWKEVFAKGNRIRFFIAFAIFTFQQVSLDRVYLFAPTMLTLYSGPVRTPSTTVSTHLYPSACATSCRTRADCSRRARHFQVDRYYRQQHLSLGLWYLRYRQGEFSRSLEHA